MDAASTVNSAVAHGACAAALPLISPMSTMHGACHRRLPLSVELATNPLHSEDAVMPDLPARAGIGRIPVEHPHEYPRVAIDVVLEAVALQSGRKSDFAG